MREVYTRMIEVEARDDREAIEKVEAGIGDELPNTLEYSHRLPTDAWTVDKNTPEEE